MTLHTPLLARCLVAACFISFGFGFSATIANATIVLQLDTESLSTRAAAIVVGHIESFQSSWQSGRIITEFQVRVAVPVKGGHQQGAVISIQQIGGRVDDLAQIIPGSPKLSAGEQVLLFLDNTAVKAKPTILGMAQGKYQLAVGPDNKLWAVRDLTNLSLAVFEETAAGKRQMRLLDHDAVDDSGALPLDQLLSEIARELTKNDHVVDPQLLERLSSELSPDGYDFSRDLNAFFPETSEVTSP